MSRGPRITRKAENIITEQALENRHLSRGEVVKQIKEKLKEKGEYPIADETLAKKVSWVRNHKPSLLDSGWSIGSLAKDPIPAGALPVVLRMHSESQLTIRQALWVARLCELFCWGGNIHMDTLRRYAIMYAYRDIVSDLLGRTHDTPEEDEFMIDELRYVGFLPKLGIREGITLIE